MGRAKEIELRVLPSKVAIPFVKRHHYSGKVVNNSILHFGAFLDGKLHGVMSFGSPMDKRKVIGLVEGTPWDGMLELNRMAFDSYLPRNAESYCISKAMKLIKKNAPNVKWVLSFADGTQCGDGAIYRASNFLLTGIRENKTILEFPTGDRIAAMTLEAEFHQKTTKELCRKMGVPHKYRTRSEWIKLGAKYIPGYMFRYIYFIDKKWRNRLTVPVIPFSKIDEIGGGMYKGKKVTYAERNVDNFIMDRG